MKGISTKLFAFVSVFFLVVLGLSGSIHPGHWAGATSKFQPMSFDVSGDSTQWTNFKLKATFSGESTIEVTVFGPGAMDESGFSASISSGTYSFACTFTSETTAGGTYAFNNYKITQGIWFTSSGTWTASYQEAPPTVTLTSPNGGENWEAGMAKNITWTTTGTVSNVKIELSTNGGSSYSTVIASTPNTGNYPWTVPNTPSANCLVKVSDASNSSVFDVSNAVFTISTPASPIISGAVKTSGGVSIEGVTVTFSDGGGTATTDSSGNYSKNVSSGWTGTVAPTKTGYTFTPSSRSYTNVTAHQTGQDYAASLLVYAVSGTVSVASAAGEVAVEGGLAGVVMNGLPGNPATNASGTYTANVDYGWSGTVTPTKAGYAFSPSSRSYTNVTANQTSQDYTGTSIAPPQIALSKNKLNFGAQSGGIATQSLSVIISNAGGGTLNWTAFPQTSWMTVTPGTGAGPGTIIIGVNATGLSAGTYTGTVLVTAAGAVNSPQTATVNLQVHDGTGAPIGVVDTPADGTTGIEGSVPVTGWAVDDIEVVNVKIYRDPVGGEGTGPNGYVYIGDAVFVEGARPDVEQAYPTYPLSYRAGWGYMMLTNFLPNGGNGTFLIHAIATDKEGNTTLLGSKTITCDNAHAVLPFGAIDVPSQGGTASGNAYINFAWVLTPMPKMIPTDGSTITAWVDGLPLGHPSYGYYRVDIATLFPGYANANGAIGYIPIDTTKYSNGVHTIVWSATDSAGVNNGFGSRYFTIQNSGSGTQAEMVEFDRQEPNRRLREADADSLSFNPRYSAYVRRGFDKDSMPETVYPDMEGRLRIDIRELERVEVNFADKDAGTAWQGYSKVGDELRELPIGTTLDAAQGILYWQPGPGFIGDYEFVFQSLNADKIPIRKTVVVTIK
jgi:hypothetical protein